MSEVRATPEHGGYWRAAAPHAVAILVVLTLVGWWSPSPFPTDQLMMERVGQGRIVANCADLNCFRILVPAVVEAFPGPSLTRWRTYAVIANTAAAVAAGGLAHGLGLVPAAVTLTIWLSALGAGSLATIYHPYNADPFVLFLAPVITLLLMSGRTLRAGALAMVGIFAKEFAAAPLYVAAAAAGMAHDWPVFRRRAAIALAVTAVWVCLQWGLMAAFGYSYNDNPSARPLEGGYLRLWLAHVTPASAVFALFSTFGALNLLIPSGWRQAPQRLQHLAIGAIPALLAFMYVATPERALWNFYFLAVPLGAVVLARLPNPIGWLFVGCYALANFRIGAQIPEVPASRYALVVSIAIASVALFQAWRNAPPTSPTMAVTT